MRGYACACCATLTYSMCMCMRMQMSSLEPRPLRMGDVGESLRFAALDGHAAEVERLLQDGANVHTVNTLGWTPLHYASANGRTQVVPILLRAGAVVDARTTGLCTPLMSTAVHGHPATIKLLLEAGADPALEDRGGETARDLAEAYDQTAAVEALDAWAVRARGGPERC